MTLTEQLQAAIQEVVNYIADQKTHGTPSCVDMTSFMGNKLIDLCAGLQENGAPVTFPEGWMMDDFITCTCDAPTEPEPEK